MGDKKYPVYLSQFKWFENGRKGNRILNFMYQRNMYKQSDKLEEGELLPIAINYWDGYKKHRTNKKVARQDDPKLRYKMSTPIISVEFIEFETWCLEHFQHYTFDIGQTDEEALLSFKQFVVRKIDLNHANGYHDMISPPIGADTKKRPFYCLMGAEDDWRWRGAEPDGKQSDQSKPPCRCKFCKERGILRIAH